MEMKKKELERLIHATPLPILEEVKIEAEKNLQQIHETENIIVNKATNLFQAILPVFIGIFGYTVVAGLEKKVGMAVIFLSILLIVLLGTCLFYLLRIFDTQQTALLGSSPSILLGDDLIANKEEDKKDLYVKIRVYSLDSAIKEAGRSLSTRRDGYKLVLKILKCGLIILGIISLLLFLYPYLFQYMSLCLSKVKAG